MLEISRGVWGGSDYLPEVFDDWVSDPGASLQVAEQEGLVIGIHRLRPVAARSMFYEGLRVAESHRGQGIATAMVRRAIEETRSLGFERMRLYTENGDAGRLFTEQGFRLLVDCVTWTARRMEGGDPPRLGSPGEAGTLAERLRTDPARAAYGGVLADWNAALDVDAGTLEHMAEQGLVRVAAGGRGVAVLREGSRRRLTVTFLAGSGAAVQDLLMALRFEADSADLSDVRVLAPTHHPAADDLAEVGYHLADDEGHAYVYGLDL